MTTRSLNILGQEVGPLIKTWGVIEEVKDPLLAKATMMTAQMECVADNTQSLFSKKSTKSFLRNRELQFIPVEIKLNGGVVFEGFLRDIHEDHNNRTATLVIENSLAIAADSLITYKATSVNPSVAALAILQSVGLTSNEIDTNSFFVAAGAAQSAGAVISVDFSSGGTSALDALQSISDLTGVAFYVNAGLIRAKAYVPYLGKGSGLKQPITSTYVINFKDKRQAFESFNNQVTVKYGASSSLTLTSTSGMNINKGVIKSVTFATNTGNGVAVPDALSAAYFGNLYLQRSAYLREVVSFDLGKEFSNIAIGERYPITDSHWGITNAAYEIIETHRAMTDDLIEVVAASL